MCHYNATRFGVSAMRIQESSPAARQSCRAGYSLVVPDPLARLCQRPDWMRQRRRLGKCNFPRLARRRGISLHSLPLPSFSSPLDLPLFTPPRRHEPALHWPSVLCGGGSRAVRPPVIILGRSRHPSHGLDAGCAPPTPTLPRAAAQAGCENS
jgi:hypothetical protein